MYIGISQKERKEERKKRFLIKVFTFLLKFHFILKFLQSNSQLLNWKSISKFTIHGVRSLLAHSSPGRRYCVPPRAVPGLPGPGFARVVAVVAVVVVARGTAVVAMAVSTGMMGGGFVEGAD